MTASLPAHFVEMARNNAFANRRLIGACAELTDEEFAATRVSFFPSLRATLQHNLEVDRYYLDALEEGGRGLSVFEEQMPESAAALLEAQAGEDARLVSLCEGLAEADLERTIITDRGKRGRFAERIDAVLAHLFQHQIHHRGQAHAMLAGTRIAPPQLDEFFLQFDRDPDAARIGGRQ